MSTAMRAPCMLGPSKPTAADATAAVAEAFGCCRCRMDAGDTKQQFLTSPTREDRIVLAFCSQRAPPFVRANLQLSFPPSQAAPPSQRPDRSLGLCRGLWGARGGGACGGGACGGFTVETRSGESTLRLKKHEGEDRFRFTVVLCPPLPRISDGLFILSELCCAASV